MDFEDKILKVQKEIEDMKRIYEHAITNKKNLKLDFKKAEIEENNNPTIIKLWKFFQIK